LGLKAVLANAHKLHSVQASVPPTTAAVLCLLLAILHRNFGPENEYAWRELWEKGCFDVEVLQAYLEKWRDRFDLFHSETPFYQEYCAEVKPKTIHSLLMHVAFVQPVVPHLDVDLIGASINALDKHWGEMTSLYGGKAQPVVAMLGRETTLVSLADALIDSLEDWVKFVMVGIQQGL